MTVAPVAANEPKGVVPPTAAGIVMIPFVPPVRVKPNAPLIVVEKLMLFPAVAVVPLVAMVVPAVKETAPVKPTVEPEVVRLPPILIGPVIPIVPVEKVVVVIAPLTAILEVPV